MNKITHRRRVFQLRKKEHYTLADKVEQIGHAQGYGNDYLAVELEVEGNGHHHSLMKCAGFLKFYWKWSAEKTTEYLKAQYAPDRDPRCVDEAVTKVYNTKLQDKERATGATLSKYPEQYPGLAEAVDSVSYKDIEKEASQLIKIPSHKVVKQLFSTSDHYINLGESRQSAGQTKRLSKWTSKQVSNQQFIVPNPMKNKTGRTQSGKKSPKCNDNILHREHLVVEFDGVACKDRQLGIFSYLSNYALLKMVLYSGGKSIHGWFHCGCSKGQKNWEQFFAIACLFGADKAMATISQYCRLPNARRDNGSKQSLLYFDPKLTNASSWDSKQLITDVKTLIK